jgi:hypothetical protein
MVAQPCNFARICGARRSRERGVLEYRISGEKAMRVKTAWDLSNHQDGDKMGAAMRYAKRKARNTLDASERGRLTHSQK